MDKVRVGLIGYGGRLQDVVGHLRKATDAVEFVGVYDPEPACVQKALTDICTKGRVYASVAEMADDPNVDWVMIGSPNHCHAEHAVTVMRGGKDLFCEKPLATDMKGVVAMQQAWKESGCRFVLGLTLRHSLLYRTIREWIQEGRLGRLVSMEFNETLDFNHGGHIHSHPWRRKTDMGGSHLLEKCCHDIDLTLWMVGSLPHYVASFGGRNFFVPENAYLQEQVACASDGRKPFVNWPSVGDRVDPFKGDADVVDNQVGIIEFANHVRATFHTNCAAGIPERRMYLLGTEAALRADVLRGEIEYQRIGFETEREHITEFVGGGHGGGDTLLGQDLAATMLEEADPVVSLQEGLASAITCFGMNEAMRTCSVVDCSDYWSQVGLSMADASAEG